MAWDQPLGVPRVNDQDAKFPLSWLRNSFGASGFFGALMPQPRMSDDDRLAMLKKQADELRQSIAQANAEATSVAAAAGTHEWMDDATLDDEARLQQLHARAAQLRDWIEVHEQDQDLSTEYDNHENEDDDRTRRFEAVVPSGWGPGDEVWMPIEGFGKVLIRLPEGATPGQTIGFTIPIIPNDEDEDEDEEASTPLEMAVSWAPLSPPRMEPQAENTTPSPPFMSDHADAESGEEEPRQLQMSASIGPPSSPLPVLVSQDAAAPTLSLPAYADAKVDQLADEALVDVERSRRGWRRIALRRRAGQLASRAGTKVRKVIGLPKRAVSGISRAARRLVKGGNRKPDESGGGRDVEP
eukprot:scaffold72561_cov26-Tisochrysis_lutea.AAC.1